MKRAIYHFAIAIAFYLGVTCAYAQSPTKTLVIQARQHADSMLNKDYETSVRYMYPPIVEMMGGFQNALEFVKASMAEIESMGLTYEKITIGQPSAIIQEGLEDVAIAPTEIVMRIEGKRVRVNSYLVAVTQNRGRNWYFFDGAQMPKEKLSQIYPKLVAVIEIPERKNTLVDEINETFRRIEEKEGKPFSQILDEKIRQVERREGKPLSQVHDESKLVIKKIEENGLRQYIENGEGKRLENIPTSRLKEILKEQSID